jgi:maltose 6'-phosphate phosphatase
MNKIKLLYVENVIIRKTAQVQQKLTFFMQVENISYAKQIDVVWMGEDEIWQTLSAKHHSMLEHNKEYWSASITFTLTEEQPLPGDIQFSLRYQVLDNVYWDNNDKLDYFSAADSGIRLTSHQPIQNIGFLNELPDNIQTLAISAAVHRSFHATKVTVHWTTDNWKTLTKTPCYFRRNYWDKTLSSNARNPNQYGIQLWAANITHDNLHNLQYAISCENRQQKILWDNNSGHNYSFQREQLKVLILNLHCYQEDNQDYKFTRIANVIDELEVDIVCLQEVAEYWRDGQGDWESNSARIINERLTKPFYIHHDWSHLGFDKYREGVAILSRYPLSNYESQYVSDSHDKYNIHSRKVVKARVEIPRIGYINVFSAHLSWFEDGFREQFQRLRAWADRNKNDDIKATLLCGDFNITAGTTGYGLVVDSYEYEDQFLAVNKQGIFDKIFRVHDAHWKDLLADDYRIDYIFMSKNSQLKAVSAKVIFTDQDYGRVSDHFGYLMTFESL